MYQTAAGVRWSHEDLQDALKANPQIKLMGGVLGFDENLSKRGQITIEIADFLGTEEAHREAYEKEAMTMRQYDNMSDEPADDKDYPYEQ